MNYMSSWLSLQIFVQVFFGGRNVLDVLEVFIKGFEGFLI